MSHSHPFSLSKMFDSVSRNLSLAKLPFFSTISFAAIFLLIILTNSFISNLSLHSVILETKKVPLHSTHEEHEKLKSKIIPVKEEVEGSETNDYTHFIPPINVTDQERIASFKNKLPSFEILKSTRLAKQFDYRVKEFLGNDHCTVQFFMTWFSPAKLFRVRELISVESVFNSHPKGCLVILSRSLDSARGRKIFKPLLDCGFRVISVTPDLPFLFDGTPAKWWFRDLMRGEKDPGEIPLAQNLSNLIRLAVLYKYGGVYIDTDFVVIKDLTRLRNSIGAQSSDGNGNWTRLNNAVLIFDKNHPILYKFIEEFSRNFNGNRWGYNGPYLVSRVIERMGSGKERNFTVLSPMAFYPVDWTRIYGLFAKPVDEAHSRWVEAKLEQLAGSSFAVHLWNRESGRLRIEEGSIIGRLINYTLCHLQAKCTLLKAF